MLDVIEPQAEQGVDYSPYHAGLSRPHIRWPRADHRHRQPRRRHPGRVDGEEPSPEHALRAFEDICRIFQKYDVAFSLGDGLRPGACRRNDEAQSPN
jgi:phosphomethylpyrimidine synthase